MARLKCAVFPLGILICGLLATPSVAQSSSNPSALRLAAQSAQAMGLSGNFTEPIRATGQISFVDPPSSGTIEVAAFAPRMFKTTVSNASSTYIYLINHDNGYVLMGGRKHYLSYQHALGQSCAYIPVATILGELSANDVVFDAPKSHNLNGRPTYILHATYAQTEHPEMEGKAQTEIEIDASTFLPLRLRMKLRSGNNPNIASLAEYSYSDYRKEGAFLLPHSISFAADGRILSTVTFESFDVNASISPADFTVR